MAGLVAGIAAGIAAAPQVAAACSWAYPVGNDPSSPAPLSNNHPVGGMNLPAYGTHLGGDYWSGGGCTDYGQTVLAAADGEIVEIVDGLGSYLDVVVIRHEDPLVGTVYSMYGHISREPGLAEGQPVDYRQPIGFIDDVLAYFSPCHLHFEILSEEAYQQGPFCSGCAAAGFHVSPGYDQQAGVVAGSDPSGDTWLEVVDAIGGNRWYHTDPFIEARLDQSCGRCGDGTCDAGEDYDDCPADCPPCTLIPPEGGTLDDAGPCFLAGGSPEYWYVEEGSGHEGSYHWTHTTDAPNVDDYGVWTLAFAEAGMYRLEVYAEPGSADTQQARYEVVHGGAVDEPVIDQSLGGWMVLGEYAFDGGGGQSLRLDDNTGEPYADMVRIVFDGVRLTRLDLPPGGTESEGSGGDTLTGPGDSDPTMGGLDTSGGASDGSAGEGGTG
ncbi:MAG: peptidoglycan DD-metalloendopeptidase family protein, partial [Myxococcales bacterium]|nr:peptidoglycan DD-metalloendopeptidase family protein [Myxococcales bacterium]